jgi:mRNA-degrading endonuclease YafQ of YafQ-DinJ toxin-antitoxin module
MNARHSLMAAGRLADLGIVGDHHFQGAETAAALVVDGKQVIACTPAEYHIAALLLRAESRLVPFRQFAHSRHALESQVSGLRRKFAPLGLSIQCEVQRGYLLRCAGDHPIDRSRNQRQEGETMNGPSPLTSAAMAPGFQASYAALPHAIRRVAARKIALLTENPAHPSLHVHRIKRCAGLWECAVTGRYRLLFERDGEQIRLVEVGPHGVIDHVHHRRR